MSEIKKKILIATGLFPPEIGGPATYSKLLLEELPKHGFAVTVLPFSTVRHLPSGVRHLVYFLKVLDLGARTDIIYAQDPVSVGLPVALANIFLGKKFILKVVGDFAWEQASARGEITECLDDFLSAGGCYHLKTKVHRLIQRYVMRQADRIIVPSNYLKKMMSRYLAAENLGKIKVIYNTVNLENVLENKGELRLKFNWAGPVIISAGRLVPWKGFSLLLELISELRKSFPTIKLIIVGDGEEKHKLEKLANESGVASNVYFAGQLDHQKLLCLIKAADIFALNTNYEGLSHVLLEAMALGTPVITTSAGGNGELIIDNETGLLVGFDKKTDWLLAIKKLLTDQALVTDITEKARVFVQQKFGREGMITDLVKELV